MFKFIKALFERETWHKIAPAKVAPPLTPKMRASGFMWVRLGDEWREVCTTCGGNCGQCGTSMGMGIPASLDTIVKTTGMNSGRHAGLGR